MRTFLLISLAVLAFSAKAMAEVENTGLRTVAQSTREFGNDFLKTVAGDKSNNLITSPLSAQVVLAMAAYGAGGLTATQMRPVLRIPEDNLLGQSGYKSLIEALNSVRGVELRLANKIYIKTGFPIKTAYKELTATKFLSASQELDFTRSTEAAKTMNDWCEEQTNHRIKDVITPDSLDGDTAAILINAVYFKGLWKTQFKPTLTQDKPFHVNALTTKNVPTMYIKNDFRFGFLPEVNARFLELPYQGDEISMIVILPNEIDGLKHVQDNLDKINIGQSLRTSYPREIEVYLPKFKIESTLDLKDTLGKMGMGNMFEDTANFSGISDISLKVSKVIQKAFIEVNEEGSEAAAVTVLIAVAASSYIWSGEPEIFSVDRPAAFMIYHRNLDTILFTVLQAVPYSLSWPPVPTPVFKIDRPFYYEIRFARENLVLFSGLHSGL